MRSFMTLFTRWGVLVAVVAVFLFMVWRVTDQQIARREEAQRKHYRGEAAVEKLARAAAKPPSAPPKFTPAVRPAVENNEWDKEARQQYEIAVDMEAKALAALDALGPRIGSPEVVETLRRWTQQGYALKRAIFAEPVYSERDLELRYDRVRKLGVAQNKAEIGLLGLAGFNRYHYLRLAHGDGIHVTDEQYVKTSRPLKPGEGIEIRTGPRPPVDSREFDQHFTQR